MKKVLLILILTSVISCGNKKSKSRCEFNYFEKVSGIKFPENVEIIDCNDTSDGLIWLNLKFDSKNSIEFIDSAEMHQLNDKIINDFEKLKGKSEDNDNIDHIMSVDNRIRQIPKNSTTYLKTIDTVNQYVIYIINKESGLFWGLIEYPE